MARLSSKGQITIPADVRRQVGLRQGDELSVRIRQDGVIELRPQRVGSLARLRELVAYDGPPVSLEDMDKGIADAVTERWKRSIQTS